MFTFLSRKELQVVRDGCGERCKLGVCTVLQYPYRCCMVEKYFFWLLKVRWLKSALYNFSMDAPCPWKSKDCSLKGDCSRKKVSSSPPQSLSEYYLCSKHWMKNLYFQYKKLWASKLCVCRFIFRVKLLPVLLTENCALWHQAINQK